MMGECDLEGIGVPCISRVIRHPTGLVSGTDHLFVYYESLKGEVKTKPINECRCDERLTGRLLVY